MPEERKLVTVLFADIVGSTKHTASHDAEVVRSANAAAFKTLARILEAHGGTVEKFIGDAVFAVFGVPVTHEDDADRAVRAAFALLGALPELNAASPFEYALRVGVNSGEVVAGTGGGDQLLVTGEPVNAGARLQQNAKPGEILVGALSRRLTRTTVEYGRARSIAAKGLGKLEATPAIRPLTALPEQRRGLEGQHAPLIGRDEEMRLLADAYRRLAADPKPFLVTVFGPAGAGKSRLARDFVGELPSDRVRRGRCLPYGEGLAYWPFREILRADADITLADAREAAVPKLRATVLAAFGEVTQDADAAARRLSVVAGVATVADALPEFGAGARQSRRSCTGRCGAT